MNITKITAFPVNSGKVKANGVVTIDGAVELKYILMQGPTDLFVSWAGGKAYKKKDGTNGWDSPIFISDKAVNEDLTKQIVTKYSTLNANAASKNTPAAGGDYQISNDAAFASDDIPF